MNTSTINVEEQATVLVEHFGGDRLAAWKQAWSNSLTDLPQRDYWIAVSEAVVEHNCISTPIGVAALLTQILSLITSNETPPAWSASLRALAEEPRVQFWMHAVQLILQPVETEHAKA